MKKQPIEQKMIPEHYEQTALLVIDVQKTLFEKRIPIYQAEALLEKINHLVERAHKGNVPVIYIQHSGKGDLARGEPGWQLHADLHPEADDLIIHKQHGNAFEGTALTQALTERQVGKLVIVGLVTHGCVKATCLGALALSYQVILAADAHSSYSEQAAQLITEWNQKLQEQGANLATTDQIHFGESPS